MLRRYFVITLCLLAAVVGVGLLGLDHGATLGAAVAASVPFISRPRGPMDWNELERLDPSAARFRRANRTISGVSLPSSWLDYSTQDNGFELVHNPLWYTRTYTDNVTTVLNFFDAPLATDDLATNTFPYQNSYLLKALGIYILDNLQTDDMGASAAALPSAFRDVQLLINTGVLDFKIGKKDYGPFPLWRLGSGGGVWGVVATAGAEAANQATNAAQVGSPNIDNIYKLAIPVVIPAQTQCIFKMRWPAAAVDLTGNRDIKLILEGIEARPKQ